MRHPMAENRPQKKGFKLALFVQCTQKKPGQDPYTAIVSVGGLRLKDQSHWICPIETAIEEIENGKQTYYININGFTPNLIVAVRAGTKYLKAPFDPDVPASLLGLPDC